MLEYVLLSFFNLLTMSYSDFRMFLHAPRHLYMD